MKTNMMILTVALASFVAVSANAETQIAASANQVALSSLTVASASHFDTGIPQAQIWDGVEVMPMCSDNDPQGLAAQDAPAKVALPAEPKKDKKMKAKGWVKEIAAKADTAKMVMDLVLKHKIQIKVKF